jgi:hypothetical protein
MKSPTMLLLLFVASAFAQGTFVNLDFEAAKVSDLPYPGSGEIVAVSNGVPGWSISPELEPGMMGHNGLPLGGADVEIYGPDWPSTQILQGFYTVGLFHSTAGPPTEASIFQTGQIPLGTKSIQFYGNFMYVVSFAGQQVPLVTLGTGPNYNILGGDVSVFAGQTGELRFTGSGLLDNIVFSTQAIPEPSVLALSALGTLLLVWRFHRRTLHQML